MTHYDDVIMPMGIGYGSGSGPQTNTNITVTGGGHTVRNARWSQKLRRLDLIYRKPIGQQVLDIMLAALRDIYEAVDGPANTFLARDHLDWNTGSDQRINGLVGITNVDQPMRNTSTGLLVGDGIETDFQLEKHYMVGSAIHARIITKPETGTLTLAVNAVGQVEGVDYTMNYSTGVATFTTPPPSGEAVTWGGAFYLKVAFIDDQMPQTLMDPETGSTNFGLIESR